MSFVITDSDGRELASGDALAALRDQLRPVLKARLQQAVPALARTGMRSFEIRSLPRRIELPGGIDGFPALVDEGESVGIRICESTAEQARMMARGTRRLLSLCVPSPRKWVSSELGPGLTLTLSGAPHAGLDAVIGDATDAALDALISTGGGPAWDAESFTALSEHVRGELRVVTLEAIRTLGRILDAVRAVRERLDTLPASAAFGPAREDVARQIGRLVFPGMLTAAGLGRAADTERYLLAAARRLDRLGTNVSADRERMDLIVELEAQAAGRPEVMWLLQEVRVAQLAPGGSVRPGATVKQVRKALAEPRARR